MAIYVYVYIRSLDMYEYVQSFVFLLLLRLVLLILLTNSSLALLFFFPAFAFSPAPEVLDPVSCHDGLLVLLIGAWVLFTGRTSQSKPHIRSLLIVLMVKEEECVVFWVHRVC